ncbi:Ras-GEF domain-containing family member 1B-A [Portunus trituberculatus]|uniref:Ras-GEF domain-containing family member 1B-A n=1 Tax=Portunus trituberculatus TaxID=210409 RepID=A0A5B7JJ42_PORTR|nr:Ras-GEF domain-containing family member 1B-A [Portunus trituberculatus]
MAAWWLPATSVLMFLCSLPLQSLVYEDGVLVSGSLQALVQHAVPTAVYYPDTAYLFAFLLSSRLFVKPHELLQRVCEVGFTQQGLKDNDLSTINKVGTWTS